MALRVIVGVVAVVCGEEEGRWVQVGAGMGTRGRGGAGGNEGETAEGAGERAGINMRGRGEGLLGPYPVREPSARAALEASWASLMAGDFLPSLVILDVFLQERGPASSPSGLFPSLHEPARRALAPSTAADADAYWRTCGRGACSWPPRS